MSDLYEKRPMPPEPWKHTDNPDWVLIVEDDTPMFMVPVERCVHRTGEREQTMVEWWWCARYQMWRVDRCDHAGYGCGVAPTAPTSGGSDE